MKEQDVGRLSSLLNKTTEQVTSAIEDGTIGDFINEFESSHEVMTKDDFETFKVNHEAQVEQKWLDDKVPKRVYDKIKGISYEVIEKEVAEKNDIEKWNGVDDLVSQIINKSAKNPENVTELKKQYTDQIDLLTATHDEKIKEMGVQNDNRFIEMQLNDIINNVPIDAEGKVLETQKKILKTLVKTEFDFGVEADALKITNAPVEFTQKNLDPKPPIDVVIDFAKDYVSLSSSAGGGRGDISSTTRTSKVNFGDYCKKNNITVNSPEHAMALKKFKDEGVEIVY